MTSDPAYTPDPASIVSAADILRGWMEREEPDMARMMFNCDFEDMAMELDRAGRLQPSGGTLSEQWTMRIHSVIDSAQPGLPYVTREEAESRLRHLLAYREGKWPATGELLRREVRGWPDGSCWIGPWQPVPTEGA